MQATRTMAAAFAVLLPLTFGLGGCHEVFDTRVEMVTLEQSEPAGDFQRLDVDIDYAVGTLEIARAAEGELYAIELDYDRLHVEPKIDFQEQGSSATLRIDMDSISGGFGADRYRNDLVLLLGEAAEIDLRLSTGVSESHLDLSGLRVRDLRLDGGVGTTEVFFEAPVPEPMNSLQVSSGVGDVTLRSIGNARVRDLKLEGGIGKTELDLSGDWEDGRTTHAEISVGVGSIELRVPRELAVEIRSDDNFLSNIHAPGFERDGDRYRRNLDDGRPTQVIIVIESGVGAVTVDII